MTVASRKNVLTREFCERDTLIVAPQLLGCILHHRVDKNTILSGIIVETEAYTQNDPACHAYKGKTPRSATLFGECARAYVYFIYGMYHCFNVVTEPYDTAGAVLIRALEPMPPLSHTHGPGRLCKSMKITKELNEVDLTDHDGPLWITFGDTIPKSKIITTTRIGISLAKDFKWRFYIKDNPHVSVKK
ncbi:MAG: DNA-3-methyladenine glycosylase [Cyanobacteriota bacterium]